MTNLDFDTRLRRAAAPAPIDETNVDRVWRRTLVRIDAHSVRRPHRFSSRVVIIATITLILASTGALAAQRWDDVFAPDKHAGDQMEALRDPNQDRPDPSGSMIRFIETAERRTGVTFGADLRVLMSPTDEAAIEVVAARATNGTVCFALLGALSGGTFACEDQFTAAAPIRAQLFATESGAGAVGIASDAATSIAVTTDSGRYETDIQNGAFLAQFDRPEPGTDVTITIELEGGSQSEVTLTAP